MRFAILSVLLFAGVAPASDDECRCRQAKAALALAAAKGPAVAPMPKAKGAAKSACVCGDDCTCAPGACPAKCPAASSPPSLTTSTGRVLRWNGTAYVYAEPCPNCAGGR